MIAKKKNVDFTQGKIFWKMFFFVLPVMATQLLQTFYNAADMMVVSLSDEVNAVGAIGTTTPFLTLIVNIFIGFSSGVSVAVGRSIGANDKERAQKAVHTAVLIAVLFGVLGTIVGISVTRWILQVMGNTGDLLALAVNYSYIYCLGVPFLALTNYLIAIYRAKGDAKTPLVVLTIAGVLHVLLNLFCVLVLHLSVEGVATATVLANVFSAAVLLIKLCKAKDETAISFKKLKIDKAAFKEILYIGVPAGIQCSLFSIANMLTQSAIVSVNNAMTTAGSQYQPVVSGNAAQTNLENFVYMAMGSVYTGAITFTSQSVGAKKIERVKPIMYNCFLIATSIGLFFTFLLWAFQTPLLALYGVKGGVEGSMEALALETARKRFFYVCLPYFLCGCMEVCAGVLRGLGKSMMLTIFSLIGSCALRVVWQLTVFKAYPTLEIIYICFPLTWVVTLSGLYATILLSVKKLKGGVSIVKKETVDIIFFCGQSNMQGQAEKLTEHNEVVENAFEYRFIGNELKPLQNPVGENLADDGSEVKVPSLQACALLAAWRGNTCLIPCFCHAYVEQRGVKTIAVHVAKGSTTIAEWRPKQRSYEMMLKKSKKSIEKVSESFEIGKRYVVWLQGESDAKYSTDEQTYKNALQVLESSLKEELGIDRFAIIKVGRFADDERDIAIAQAQESICEENENFVMLTRITNDLLGDERYVNPDVHGHYSSDGLELLGKTAGENLGRFANGEEFCV